MLQLDYYGHGLISDNNVSTYNINEFSVINDLMTGLAS
ncbi:hypothetical protein LS25_1729 [Latilactobacillus sakei subsp. sakei LS25]|nr:hypothetical protein LS25_1729 [Latilactobacillus sakei subsp. sakei LS25]